MCDVKSGEWLPLGHCTWWGGGAQRRFYYSGSILFLHLGDGYTRVCENSTSYSLKIQQAIHLFLHLTALICYTSMKCTNKNYTQKKKTEKCIN